MGLVKAITIEGCGALEQCPFPVVTERSLLFQQWHTGNDRERRADDDERIPDSAGIEAMIDAVVEDLKKSALTATQPQ